ncbi:polymeric immunoglobulin receptor-like protein [Labeo rohita]|nr:polymeric immunoglobulin receptor-like protein [Labeo rohita]
MKILLIFFTFYLISGAVKDIDVTGYSGGSVLVDSGKRWFSDSAKYLAKIPEWRIIINNTKYDKWINEGRFTLFQNSEGNLMIYIKDVNQHDATEYQIKVEGKWSINMTLNVKEGSNRVMVNIGETASFSCEYSQNHINDPKILFKEEKDSIETIYSTWNKKERFSISDDKHENLFTVRITAVTPDDGGVYLCGVWIKGQSYSYSIINTVHLRIMELNLTKYEGDDVSIQCKHQDEDQKRFCKAHEASMCVKDGVSLETIRDDRFSFSDEASTGVFTVNITDLREEDSGIYWCGAHVTTKVHLNINKKRERASTSDKTKREKHSMSSCADSRRDSLSDPGSVPMNSHDDPPTIPSDWVLYAAVSFQKRGQLLSDSAVRLSKDEIDTDYTTVICH